MGNCFRDEAGNDTDTDTQTVKETNFESTFELRKERMEQLQKELEKDIEALTNRKETYLNSALQEKRLKRKMAALRYVRNYREADKLLKTKTNHVSVLDILLMKLEFQATTKDMIDILRNVVRSCKQEPTVNEDGVDEIQQLQADLEMMEEDVQHANNVMDRTLGEDNDEELLRMLQSEYAEDAPVPVPPTVPSAVTPVEENLSVPVREIEHKTRAKHTRASHKATRPHEEETLLLSWYVHYMYTSSTEIKF